MKELKELEGFEMKVLNCGHQPSEHGSTSTGTAHLNGKGKKVNQDIEICCSCADRAQKFYMKNHNRTNLYLSGNGKEVHTWSGGKMSVSCKSWTVNHNMWSCPELTFINMTDHFGNRWYGKNSGNGMFVKLHKVRADW